LEALWKHEAEKRRAIPTDRAQRGRFAGIGKRRKLRENSRLSVIVHGSFGTTHNLKVASLSSSGELLIDNIAECRANLLETFADYLELDGPSELYRAASHVLSQNLMHGDALTMRACDGQPIILPSGATSEGASSSGVTSASTF
jgi:hypothetical protein